MLWWMKTSPIVVVACYNPAMVNGRYFAACALDEMKSAMTAIINLIFIAGILLSVFCFWQIANELFVKT